MITPRMAIYAYLSADPDIQNLVGTRIYPQTVPQNPIFPLIVLNTISSTDERDLQGRAWSETRIQITAMADTLRKAETIIFTVRAKLEGYKGMMAGVLEVLDIETITYNPTYQDDVGLTHYHLDVLVKHK
jgi:Protein of unknown function (DUF3168).